MSNVFRSLLIDSIFEMEYNPIVPYARVAWVLTYGSILFDEFCTFWWAACFSFAVINVSLKCKRLKPCCKMWKFFIVPYYKCSEYIAIMDILYKYIERSNKESAIYKK